MVAQTNLGIPPDLDTTLLCFFGFSVAAVVCLNMVAMLNSTFILIAIYKFDTESFVDEKFSPKEKFRTFWAAHCAADWRIAFYAFSSGIPMFLIMLAFTSWIDFWGNPDGYIGGYIVTSISAVTLLYWSLSAHQKWGAFMTQVGLFFLYVHILARYRRGQSRDKTTLLELNLELPHGVRALGQERHDQIA